MKRHCHQTRGCLMHLRRLSDHAERAAAAQPQVVAVLPVVPGDTIPLPFDHQGLLARLDVNGNLAIRSGARTYILQNYIAADLRSDVTVLADDGSVIDLPLVIAATGPEVAFPTAAGFGGAPTSSTLSGNGIFTPLSGPDAVGPLGAVGVLNATDAPPGETTIPLRSSPEPDTFEETAGGGAGPPGNSVPTAEDLALSAAEDGEPVDAAFGATDSDPADQGKLAFAVLTQPAEGAVTDNGDGTFTYDPGAGFQELALGETVTQSFTYQTTDPQGAASNVATVTITIAGVNDAPTAIGQAFSTTEDGPIVIGTLSGDDIDSDDDAKSLTYILSSLSGKGTLTDKGDGTFSFDHGTAFTSLNAGDTENVSFTYQTTDKHGALSAEATVTITVTGVNDAPVASDVAAAAKEDGGVVIGSYAATDVDDTGPFAFAITQQPAEGTATDNGDGTFSFDPDAGFQDLGDGETRVVTFQYTAKDPGGATSNVATGTVIVTGVNDAPTALDKQFTTSEDGPIVDGSLAGDDVDSDDTPASLAFVLGTPPTKGTFVDNGDGTFSFDPGSDFASLGAGDKEDVTFTYQTKDSHGALSAPATVTITVTGANDAPVASDVTAAAQEDGGAVIGSYIATDSDDASLAFTITQQPTEGTVTDNGDGTFSFDPATGFQDLGDGETRDVTFTYTAKDPGGAVSNIATGTITVAGVNDAPIANTVSAKTNEDSKVTAAFAATDMEDPPAELTYTIVTGTVVGTVTANPGGTFTYDPGDGFQLIGVGKQSTITFTYQATDSQGLKSGIATGFIVVTGLNDPAVAKDVSIAAVEDGPTVSGSFIAKDPDLGDSLTYKILTAPAEGTLVNNNNGTFSFSPGAGFQDLAAGKTRDVTFTYTATDESGAVSNAATGTITVTGVNDAPTAIDKTFTTSEDGPIVDGSLAGDDIDSDDTPASLAFVIGTTPTKGTFVDNGDGTFSFDPGSDFEILKSGESEDVTFTYQAKDSHGVLSAPATVTITVTGANDPPVASDVTAAANEDGGAVIGSYAVSDPDASDKLTFAITQQPAESTVTDNGDGTFSFDPGAGFQDLAAGETRDVTFTYTAKDASGATSNAATGTITISGVNDAPVPQDAALAATEDGAPVSAAFAGDDVDSDDDQASLKYVIVTPPAEGTVTNNGDGTFSFDPGTDFQDLAAGETRDVTFTYTATDKNGAVSNTATVVVTVTGISDTPVASDVAAAAQEDGGAVIGSYAASDPDASDTLAFAITQQPAEGIVIDNGDGTFTFDPGTGFQDLAEGKTRDVTFTYTATDPAGGTSNVATGTITVTGVNDVPIAEDINAPPSEQQELVVGIFKGSDVDTGDSLEFKLTSLPDHGIVVNNDDGTFTFDPNGEFNALAESETKTVSFDYVAVDQTGAAGAPATVTLTITGSNDAPTVSKVAVAATEDGQSATGILLGDDLDSDDDTASLKYVITSVLPIGAGTVTNNGDGTFTYDPGSGFQELAEGETTEVFFAYKAIDSHVAISDFAIGTITVTGTNDAPTALDQALSTTEDDPIVIASLAGEDIDSDDDATSLTYVIGILPGKGTLTDSGDGTFTFDPGGDFDALQAGKSEDVTFTYQSKDSHSVLSAPATVTITVTGVNDAPVASDVAVAAQEDGGAVIGSYVVSDVDASGAFTFAITEQPDEGAVTDNGDGTFSFDPAAGFQELAEGETTQVIFRYTATDASGAASQEAIGVVTITGVNDDPAASDINLVGTDEVPSITGDFEGDDIDSDDDRASLAYTIVDQPSAGTVVNNGDGTFTFIHGPEHRNLGDDESAGVTFNYTATDSKGAISSKATVFVTIFGINTAPVAADVAVTSDEDMPVTTSFSATDKQDLPEDLVYKIVSGPDAGTVTINDDGTFSFDPGNEFQGLDAGETKDATFTYTATDSQGLVSNSATAIVTVTGLNDAPVAANVAAAAAEDGPAVLGLFAADDVDGNDVPGNLIYTILSQPAEGTVASNGDGSFTFTPGTAFQDLAEGETRLVSFTYQAKDQSGAASNIATATITVTGKNDGPTAQDLAVTVTEGLVSAPIAFKGDDIDSDDTLATLAFAITQPPSDGTVIMNPDGTFVFDPGTDFDFLLKGQSTTVTFTYTATDSHGVVSAPATVTITITGANVVPVSDHCPIPPAAVLDLYTYIGGTKNDDTIRSSAINNNHWIQGFDGNDVLNGANLADLIEGGDGNDRIDGDRGVDVILAGAGDDTILGGGEIDCVDAGAGNDTVDGGLSNDDLHGDEGDDGLS